MTRRPLLEPLEDRQMLSVFLVTNTNDSGTGSLRQAILDANAHANSLNPGAVRDEIRFAFRSVPMAIKPRSELPIVTDPVVIDDTPPAGSGNGTSLSLAGPYVRLDGSGAGPWAHGLWLRGGNSIVRGLAIFNFGQSGIAIDGAGRNEVSGNYIGTDGFNDLGNRNGVSIGLPQEWWTPR